jgi:hypothetical protein
MPGFMTPSSMVKRFLFKADKTTQERGVGGYTTRDTTSASTTSTTRVTLKTYTFSVSGVTNKIRVRSMGATGNGIATGTFILVIDGVDKATFQTISSTTVLLWDYIGDITTGSHTVRVDGYAGSGDSIFTNDNFIVAGYGIVNTSANPQTILTITSDSYELYVDGAFKYKVGCRWYATGNRKTTATASIYSNLANETLGTNNLGANDDTVNIVNLLFRTGDYASSFTVSGYVGASGDVIIVTGIYLQVCLRGNQTDMFNFYSYWAVTIEEKGIVNARIKDYSLVGISTNTGLYEVEPTTGFWLSIAAGVDVWYRGGGFTVDKTNYNIAVHRTFNEDFIATEAIIWVDLMVVV